MLHSLVQLFIYELNKVTLIQSMLGLFKPKLDVLTYTLDKWYRRAA